MLCGHSIKDLDALLRKFTEKFADPDRYPTIRRLDDPPIHSKPVRVIEYDRGRFLPYTAS